MSKFFVVLPLLFSFLQASNLDALLERYENKSKTNIKTINEKLGHVLTYNKKEIEKYNYKKLSDILKEIPATNIQLSNFGLPTLSLATSKSQISSFFRVYINDFELNSAYNASPFLEWGDISLEFINHIEIYLGEGSFGLSGAPGIFFIKLYTIDAKKTNSNEINLNLSKNLKETSFLSAKNLKNDWQYLAYVSAKKQSPKTTVNNEIIENELYRQTIFGEFVNKKNKINLGFSEIKKDSYTGFSKDLVSDDGEIKSKSFFISSSNYFLDDNSLKTVFSYAHNRREYREKDSDDIRLPLLNDVNEVEQSTSSHRISANISKTIDLSNSQLLINIGLINKKFNNNKTIIDGNVLSNHLDFDKETMYSSQLEYEYDFLENLKVLANTKIDYYDRNGKIEDSTEKMYRIGMIYTPYETFGIKTFYTKTYLAPTFYNNEFKSITQDTLESQKYKYLTIEPVYQKDNHKIRLIFHKVKIEDFIYYIDPLTIPNFNIGGFVNTQKEIRTYGYNLYYDYNISSDSKIQLNYFITKINDIVSSPNKGGYIKYFNSNNNIDYYLRFNYRNGFTYQGLNVKPTYDFDLGFTYNYNKDLSLSLDGKNIFNKSTKSLFNNLGTYTALKNSDSDVLLSIKWRF